MARRRAVTPKRPRRLGTLSKRKQRQIDKLLGEPVRSRIVSVLRKNRRLGKRAASEAAFHMVDWLHNLSALARVFRRPNSVSDEEFYEAMMRFLFHVPHHLVAAHLIVYGEPVKDIFELGAVKGTGKPKRKPGGPYPDERPKRVRRKS